jgi:hypothetical protein
VDIRETAGKTLGTPEHRPANFRQDEEIMLTIDTAKKALGLLDLGYTYPDIERETGITREDASAVASAYDKDETAEQLFRELQLAGVLELAAAKLRSGEGWQESTTVDVFNEILHVYSPHVKKALAMALLVGRF